MIDLPTTHRSDSYKRQFGVYLMNWFFWIVPAAADSLSGDVGYEYGLEKAFFVAITIATWFGAWIASDSTAVTGLTGWMCILGAFVIYLAIGVAYHISNHKWGRYIRSRR